MPHFMILLVLYINSLNLSWIKLSVFEDYRAFNPCPAEPGYTLPFANSIDSDQLDLHCLSLSI